jgi:penicillin V acylase-like amidase (Ntn superfamily)
MMPNFMKHALLSTCCLLLLNTPTQACTRTLFIGDDNTVITGRSMDWSEDMGSNLWVFPRGIQRNGLAGKSSPTWTSKYGSVVASVYNLASADGMNEKGLVMNMLYLTESDYGQASADQPSISVSLWGQYALDNFATVAEAVASMQANPFHIAAPNLPNGDASTVHLSLSDTSGDSAILEYIAGKLVVHHGKAYQVMTNSPIYSKQLALNEYWENIGGTVFLPGTNRAADRFARASFLIHAIPKAIDPHYIQAVPQHTFSNQATAGVLSVMRSVSVPLGITTPQAPNIASTLWRTISDQKNLIYYFDASTQPNTFWVSLQSLDFKPGAAVLKLALSEGELYSGEVAKAFKPADAFQFLSGENVN